jgi:hypothetical protein
MVAWFLVASISMLRKKETGDLAQAASSAGLAG